MTASPAVQVRRRQIVADDLGALADLLTQGFPARTRDYWSDGLERMRLRQAPEMYPRFGFMLEAAGEPVGVILLVFSHRDGEAAAPIQCNLSSWYVREAYRGFATLLTAAALSFKEVTYINSSPAGYTWAILESQGYVRYGQGQLVSLPWLSVRGVGAKVSRFDGTCAHRDLPEADLLAAHQRAGCVCLVVTSPRGFIPFVFIRWRLKSRLKMMRLLWCRDTADYVRFAGPLGRNLLRHGVGAVALDAVGRVSGLPGVYFDGAEPKYFRGPNPPRLNDLAFTEQVLFGV